MADPNAKRDSALQDIARLLKEQNRILETMNNNIVEISKIFDRKQLHEMTKETEKQSESQHASD